MDEDTAHILVVQERLENLEELIHHCSLVRCLILDFNIYDSFFRITLHITHGTISQLLNASSEKGFGS